MIKNLSLLAGTLMAGLSSFGANPSFQSFDPHNFSVAGNDIIITNQDLTNNTVFGGQRMFVMTNIYNGGFHVAAGTDTNLLYVTGAGSNEVNQVYYWDAVNVVYSNAANPWVIKKFTTPPNNTFVTNPVTGVKLYRASVSANYAVPFSTNGCLGTPGSTPGFTPSYGTNFLNYTNNQQVVWDNFPDDDRKGTTLYVSPTAGDDSRGHRGSQKFAWQTLQPALTNCLPGDTIVLDSGWISASNATLPTYTTIYGQGRGVTYLYVGGTNSATAGLIVDSGCKVRDMTLIVTNDETLGTFYFPMNTTSTATNLLFENIDIVGQNDAWYFNGSSCTSTAMNCRAFSHWDAFYNTANSTNSYFKFINCTFNSTAGTVSGGWSNNANGLIAFGGNIELLNCSVVAANAFTNTCGISALTNSTLQSHWLLKNTTIQATSQYGNSTNIYIIGPLSTVDQYIGDFIYYPNRTTLGLIVMTNFISGQKYTNNTGRPITVRSLAFTAPNSVNGQATMDLLVDQTQSGTFIMFGRVGHETVVGGGATGTETNWWQLSAAVMTNGVYTFTNTSVGAGQDSELVPGSGQLQIN